MNVFRISFGRWLLMFSLCLLYGNLQAQVWLTVKDGNTSSPYYTFKTPHHVPIDISTYGFERGQSYVFLPQGVSTSHPFMIGEYNGDMNSSIVSVFGAGGNPLPLTYNYSNLQISIPINYNGDLVYFSTNDSSVHYHLKIVDPPGGNYQSSAGGYQTQGSSYQPVYDLNVSHLTALSTSTGQFAAKFSFFNDTNSSGSPEIRTKMMLLSNGQFQPDTSLGYYIAKPNLFPTIAQVYDYLTSINLSPINGYTPPLVYYQSHGSGYQSGGGGTIAITAPGNGSNADPNTDLTVTIQYASGGGGYQTPIWAYRIDSGFPGYGSQHGGTQVTGVTSVNDFLSGRSNGMRQVNVALLDQAGNLHNPPIVQTISVNYQSAGGGYQTGSNGYQTGGGGYQTPNTGYQTPVHGYQTPVHGYQTPATGYQTTGHGYQAPTSGYQTPGHGYQTPGHGYQTPTTGYQTSEDGQETLVLVNQISQVRTLSHQILSSSILLTGELLDQNISAIHSLQVGFFISPSMQIATDDPLTQKVYAEKSSSHSFSANFEPGSHSILYFRAFAQSMGQTTLGNIRKISIEGNLNQQNQKSYQEALSILALDSMKEDGGWVKNPWFGRYKNFNNGWIYHSIHGWLYLASDNFNGIWAWAETRGWVWSNKAVYPFLYQSNIGNWIYVMSNDVNEVRYYNYSTNLFENVLP